MIFSRISFAQTEVGTLSFIANVGLSKSYYKPKTSFKHRIECYEVKAGFSTGKSFGKFGLNGGINAGHRFSQRNEIGVITEENPSDERIWDYQFLEGAKRVYTSERFFLEVPITVSYNPLQSLEVHLGALYRRFDIKKSSEFHQYMQELGPFISMRYWLDKRVAISFDYMPWVHHFKKSVYTVYGAPQSYNINGKLLQVTTHVKF